MKPLRRGVRHLLVAATGPLSREFERALDDPGGAQRRVRDRLARMTLRSAYGRHHGLTRPEDFRLRLPVVDHDDLAPWIARAAAGEHGVLSPERIEAFEPTSGSSGLAKWIPYPPALRRAFTRMALLWMRDLAIADPRLGTGRFYFSVSPPVATRSRTPGGHRVGLDSDADYLGGLLRPLLAPFVVTVPGLAGLHDPVAFRRATAVALLAARDLEALSVWNPTFLTVLLDHLESHRDDLLADPGLALPPATREAFSRTPLDWQAVWPELRLISCWTDAMAAPRAAELARRLPFARLQGKGLLATEAPVTVPLVGVEGGVPLLTEVYFEFELPDGEVLELHELEPGMSAGLVVSQPGGLLRYRLGDQVRVVGRHRKTPTLAFEGRTSLVSDLVGEKLSEPFLRAHLRPLLPPEATLATFVPRLTPREGYLLVLDRCAGDPGPLAQALETALRGSHHYRLARDLGQLEALEVVVSPGAEQGLIRFHGRAGQRLGDIKPALLVKRPADALLLDELGLGGAG